MIKVTLTREGNKLSLRLVGHAGYAEVGKDIVCASASTLGYTTAQLFLEMNANGKLTEYPTVKLCEGDITIEAECKDNEALYEAKQIMRFAEAGYSLLQNSYPEYVKFVINEA
jgi:uncharacterized protein YsxB (DUF464 family)